MKHSFIKYLVTVFLFTFTGLLFAQAKWVVFDESERMTYYIDSASIKKTNQFARVWSLIQYKTPKQNGYFQTKSVTSLEEYDCKEEKIHTLKQTLYSGDMGTGESYGIDLSNDKWSYITPSTISDYIKNFVCKKNK